MRKGQKFVVDDWDNKVTENDMGSNYFSGNTGATETVSGITTIGLSTDSNGSTGDSLRISFDFSGQDDEVFAGFFASLFGLTDTLVSLDNSGIQPTQSTPFPGYYLDINDIYRGFKPLENRSMETLRFDIKNLSGQSMTAKIELKDEANNDTFVYHTIGPGGAWQTVSFAIPGAFTRSLSGSFDWRKLSVFAVIIERNNIGAGISNPDSGTILIDNLVLIDTDGVYPDLSGSGARKDLAPDQANAFLDWVRATSMMYFIDWASTDTRTGGIIQDRSFFADLMSIGGVGFQLTAYVIGAERGYMERSDAANWVVRILRVLDQQPQGSEPSGNIGYKGFFYHFLGIDGLRKLNFDFTATEDVNEALNTVELSTIDTALAIAGVVTVGQYFGRSDGGIEDEIRTLADDIYARVNWPFMLNRGAKDDCQFYLGWKPLENREGAAFDYPDADGLGHYSGSATAPQVLDFYTDEAILIALLAMGSPNPDHRVDRCAWDNIVRDDAGGSFVKTYPGALFTYHFASVWLDTDLLGEDNHPTHPLNFYLNTRSATQAVIDYAELNPGFNATLSSLRWGLSATEGPFDAYFAEAAPTVALAEPSFTDDKTDLEAENGTSDGTVMQRSNASGDQTVQLCSGESCNWTFNVDQNTTCGFTVYYSNDNYGPLEQIAIRLDGGTLGFFSAQDTGDYGQGWNIFVSDGIGSYAVAAGERSLTLDVSGGDSFGVEIDKIELSCLIPERPLEAGTVTNYGVGSAIYHLPHDALSALWNNATQEDLNQDGTPELLHPRFGFADAFNLDISDPAVSENIDCNNPSILRCTGPWVSFTGFGIDHGPMLIMIDNYLEHNFIPHLFMSHVNISQALAELFPTWKKNVLSLNTTNLHLPELKSAVSPAKGSIDLFWAGTGLNFALQRIGPVGGPADDQCTFNPVTGLVQIPVLHAYSDGNLVGRFAVDMTVSNSGQLAISKLEEVE